VILPSRTILMSMKHLTRDEVALQQLLQRARTVAVVGASPRPKRHSHQVCRYLHDQGYDVIPVRPDRADVAGLPSYAQLSDVPGSVDIVVVFRNAAAAPEHIRQAADKTPEAIWLPPGVWSRACDDEGARAGVTLVVDACIEEEHRHGSRVPGHPRKLGVHRSRRKRAYSDNRKRPEEDGYVAGGGGGHAGGGGVRAVLDEKKMAGGRPSPRRGLRKLLAWLRLRGRHHGK
jgi:predicted CoA-binding protein